MARYSGIELSWRHKRYGTLQFATNLLLASTVGNFAEKKRVKPQSGFLHRDQIDYVAAALFSRLDDDDLNFLDSRSTSMYMYMYMYMYMHIHVHVHDMYFYSLFSL